MKNVLIVGAGRLGKGFIGETFDNAGWNITFLDKDLRVIEELNKTGSFTVKVHRVEEEQIHTVTNFKAYTCDKAYSCLEAFLETDVIVLPLYPEDFEEAGQYLSQCFEEFHKIHPDRKLTLICITNKNYLIPEIEKSFKNPLTKETRQWFEKQVVIRDSIIRRGTDAESNYATEIDSVAVKSLLIQKPVNNDFSDVEWMELADKIEIMKDIKVTAINGPHATTAFLGYLKRYETIPESENDLEIMEIVKGVTEEIIAGIMKEYSITEEELQELIFFPEAKGILPDSIYRVAYDPIRKLAKGDRLTGAAETNLKHGLDFTQIATGIAAGFAYAEPKDKKALKLQQEVNELGIEKAVPKYIGLPEDHTITQTVLKQYKKLQDRGWIK